MQVSGFRCQGRQSRQQSAISYQPDREKRSEHLDLVTENG
jgi:hypothetical protein